MSTLERMVRADTRPSLHLVSAMSAESLPAEVRHGSASNLLVFLSNACVMILGWWPVIIARM